MRTNRRRFPDKTVNEAKLYAIDWAPETKTETVSSVAWSSNPAGLTFTNQLTTGAETRAMVGGGTEGEEYAVSVKMTKSNAEVVEVVAWLKVNPSDEVV